MDIQEYLKEIKTLERSLLKQLDVERGKKKFVCGCGEDHVIKDCVAIQTHWYTSPHGCTGGDYWNEGEIQIICPVTDNKNRIHFKDPPDYKFRLHYTHSAEMQFSRLYMKLFKEVIQDYKIDKRSAWINNYFDNNRQTFHLHVAGVDTHDAPIA